MTPTIRRVLFPTDFSACAEGAYRHAAYLADRFGAELHVLHVVEDESAPERDWPEAAGTGHLKLTMADVCEDLGLPPPPADRAHDPYDLVEIVEEEIVGRNAVEAILDYAHDEGVDLVVMGTHGRSGWRRGVLGSVAESVARRAPCPVLTVRPLDAPGERPWPPARVLLALGDVPYGGFDAVPPAALWAARLAVAYRAPLEVVHVTNPGVRALGGPALAGDEEDRMLQTLDGLVRALRAATDPGLPVSTDVREGFPADEVRAVAESDGVHLLVVGTHGRQGVRRALLGSVAEDLVRTAPCPVLVARDAPSVGRRADPDRQRAETST